MSFESIVHQAKQSNCIIYRTDDDLKFDVNGAVCAIMTKTKRDKWVGTLLPDHPCKSEKRIVGTKVGVAKRCLLFSINF